MSVGGVFQSLAFGKRRDDETENERLMKDGIEHALTGAFTLRAIDQISDKVLPKVPLIGKLFRDENKDLDTRLKQLQVIAASRKLGMSENDALEGNIMDAGRQRSIWPNQVKTANTALNSIESALEGVKRKGLLGLEFNNYPHSILDDILSSGKKSGKLSAVNSLIKLTRGRP